MTTQTMNNFETLISRHLQTLKVVDGLVLCRHNGSALVGSAGGPELLGRSFSWLCHILLIFSDSMLKDKNVFTSHFPF